MNGIEAGQNLRHGGVLRRRSPHRQKGQRTRD
jgi:hypothetical protein